MDNKNLGLVDRTATTYLRYFKIVVVILMSILVAVFLYSISVAIVNLSQKPSEPPAPKAAPEKSVEFDQLVKFSLEREKQRKLDEERKKAGGNVQYVPSSEAGQTVKYLEQATKFYRCVEEFNKATSEQVPVVSVEEANRRIEQYRDVIEKNANKQNLGDDWVSDFIRFSCESLSNPELIKLKAEGQISAIPIIQFHSRTYEAIQLEKIKYESDQRQKVQDAVSSETLRIVAAKGQGMFYLTVALSAFGVWFALALFLILSKIELNLAMIASNSKSSIEN